MVTPAERSWKDTRSVPPPVLIVAPLPVVSPRSESVTMSLPDPVEMLSIVSSTSSPSAGATCPSLATPSVETATAAVRSE